MANSPMNGFGDDEDEMQDIGGDSEPVSSVAGPQTTRDQVVQRISEVRNPAAAAPASDDTEEDDSSDTPSEAPGVPNSAAALEFAKNSAMNAGLGRALNALSSGTGFKPDNASYDNMEKQGTDIANKAMQREEMVKKAIEDRKMKQLTLEAQNGNKEAERQLKEKQIQAYGDRTKSMTGLAQNRADATNIRAANTILGDKNAQLEVKKLQTARSAQSLVDAIRNGDITDSSNVARQLTNMITTIEMGTPGGVTDRKNMGVDTAYTSMQKMLSWVTGHPKSAIPKDYLAQLENETHALGDRAAANYKNITDGALGGADLSGGNVEADPGKIHHLAKQRRDLILTSNGYDPDTGLATKRKDNGGDQKTASGMFQGTAQAKQGVPTSADMDALDWLKANPQDPHAADVEAKLRAKGINPYPKGKP